MKTIYITVDNNGRITGYGSSRGMDTDIEIQVEEDHELLDNPLIYYYVDGQPRRMSQEELDSFINTPKPPTIEEKLAKTQDELIKTRNKLSQTEETLDGILTVLLPSIVNSS